MELRFVQLKMLLGNIQCGLIKTSPVPTSWFLVCRFFLFIPASPSVLHLSFPLCPSSPLLFITLLIKPDHPERTDFRGGWVRGWEGHKERDMKGRTEKPWDRLLLKATWGDQLDQWTSNINVIWNECVHFVNSKMAKNFEGGKKKKKKSHLTSFGPSASCRLLREGIASCVAPFTFTYRTVPKPKVLHRRGAVSGSGDAAHWTHVVVKIWKLNLLCWSATLPTLQKKVQFK